MPMRFLSARNEHSQGMFRVLQICAIYSCSILWTICSSLGGLASERSLQGRRIHQFLLKHLLLNLVVGNKWGCSRYLLLCWIPCLVCYLCFYSIAAWEERLVSKAAKMKSRPDSKDIRQLWLLDFSCDGKCPKDYIKVIKIPFVFQYELVFWHKGIPLADISSKSEWVLVQILQKVIKFRAHTAFLWYRVSPQRILNMEDGKQ